MKISLGNIYVNRTRAYLAPIINAIGKTIAGKIAKTSVLAWGIYDTKYKQAKNLTDLKYYLFILQDTKGAFSININRYINETEGMKHYSRFLDYVRTTRNYVDDYPFDFKRSYHMIVLRIPEEFHSSYDNFLEGNFSKMYDTNQLFNLRIPKFSNKAKTRKNPTWQVLTKDVSFRKTFQEALNNKFGSDIDRLEDGAELDTFWVSELFEIFNAPYPGVKPPKIEEYEEQY